MPHVLLRKSVLRKSSFGAVPLQQRMPAKMPVSEAKQVDRNDRRGNAKSTGHLPGRGTYLAIGSNVRHERK